MSCTIWNGETVVDWAWNRQMPDQAQSPQAIAATLTLAAPATLVMKCRTDYTEAHVREARMVATRVASITETAQPQD